MKTRYLQLTSLTATLFISSCASQTPQSADYNGDGNITNSEYDQFMKRKSSEAINMQNERAQISGFSNTILDVQNSMTGMQNISSMLGH